MPSGLYKYSTLSKSLSIFVANLPGHHSPFLSDLMAFGGSQLSHSSVTSPRSLLASEGPRGTAEAEDEDEDVELP